MTTRFIAISRNQPIFRKDKKDVTEFNCVTNGNNITVCVQIRCLYRMKKQQTAERNNMYVANLNSKGAQTLDRFIHEEHQLPNIAKRIPVN